MKEKHLTLHLQAAMSPMYIKLGSRLRPTKIILLDYDLLVYWYSVY